MSDGRKCAVRALAALFAQQYEVDQVRSQVAASVVAQSQRRDPSSTSRLLLADDPRAVLDQLSTVDARQVQRSQMMVEFAGRVERPSRSSGRAAPAAVPASGRAAVAVRFATAQVGKAHVFGAAGPSAYDRSGLTMRAWGAAGAVRPG